jgi:translation initiation factor 5B
MHGLEPQTKESIELLKSRKTPFVVALNKIDRLNEWQTSPHTDVATTLSKQRTSTQLHFNDRVRQIVVEFAELGLNVALFHENRNIREYISMVPTSAHSGDGMGNLIALICELTQSLLARQLMYSDDLQATVMEVKALPGLGTTIDVILVNGRISEGDTIIVAGQEGPIVTQIRALLMPQPLRELRVKSAYEHHKEVRAAQGCKIVAKDLEKALAGLPLFVAKQPDEVEVHKDELSQMLTDVLGSIKVQERGVFVQASTLGSLEALLVFLASSKIPYAGINIGPVHRRDVMKASIMMEHDPQYAVILAFDVKVEREAQEMADSLGVRIFVADIIYHLFDRFTKYREEWMHQKQEEFRHLAVFPCKLRILPSLVFNSRDPIVAGVNVEAGFLKEGTMLCVPSKEFLEIGRVSSIQVNHKAVEKATRGQEVCIKVDPVPGEAPKMFGRHFDHTDLLVSKISRETIDVVKNYFREEMSKADWQLIVELKKTFGIL